MLGKDRRAPPVKEAGLSAEDKANEAEGTCREERDNRNGERSPARGKDSVLPIESQHNVVGKIARQPAEAEEQTS